MGEMLKQFIANLREHDPAPLVRSIARTLAGALLLLFAVILYAPALGDSSFIYGTDTVSHDYIMHKYGWDNSIGERGELPLWNPYSFSGLPMVAAAALCPFYPTQWLYAIFPFNTGFTLQYIFALAVGGIGAAWWMRTLGHRRSIALWAGFLYMVSGHFLTLTHAGHLQKMIALGWTPVALGATIQLVQLGRSGVRHSIRYKAAALLGLALAMQMLATHPQIFYATAVACVLQLIGMSLTSVPWKKIMTGGTPGEKISFSRELRPVGRAIAMSILALAVCVVISAVQLIPSYEMSGLSNRAEGVTFTEATQTSYPPLEIFEYAVPSIFGDSIRGSQVPYFGNWGERIVSDYIGIPVLFLAVIGLFGSKRRYRWFLLILLLSGLIIGLGRHTPVYWLLFHSLPGFDGFRSPGTYMFLANCALIGLAAFGLDYLVSLATTVNNEGWDSSFSDKEDKPAADPAPAVATAPGPEDTQPFQVDSVMDYNGTDTPPYNRSIDYEEYPEAEELDYHYSGAPQARVSSSNFTWDNENTPWLGRPGTLVFIAAMAIAALVATIIALAENWDVNLKIATADERLSHHTYSRVAGGALSVTLFLGAILLLRLRTWIGGIAIAMVALAFPLYYNSNFLRFEPLNPYLAHLTRQPDLTNLAETAPQPVRLVEESALKNEAMMYNISLVAGYHPIVPAGYSAAGAIFGLDSDMFGSLFAVNHARTNSENPPANGTWTLDENTRGQGRSGAMWSRTPAFPYVRDRANVQAYDTDDSSLTSASLTAMIGQLQTSADETFPAYVARISNRDLRRYRLIEGQQTAEAQLQRWSPHEIRLRVRASAARERAGALLPVSDPWYPGWKAETSDGRRLPVIAVNGIQRGLVLPPGEHNVRLRFSPYSQRLGLFITLTAVTLLLSFGIGTITRRLIKGRKKVKKVIKRARGSSQTATYEAAPQRGAETL